MTESAVTQLWLSNIGLGAAAVALLYVVYLFVSGKVHSQSEMDAKDDVIAKLEKMNAALVVRLDQTNAIFEKAIDRGYTRRTT